MRAFRSSITLALASSALVLFASARQWVHLTYLQTGLPTIELDLSGRDLDPLPAGLAVLVVAAVLALLISRGFTHRILAFVVLLAGVAIAVTSWTVGAHPEGLSSITDHLEAALGGTATGKIATSGSLWWVLSCLCGCFIAASALALFRFGPSRPRSGSTYERSSAKSAQMSPWQALDQGVDPTTLSDH